MCTGPMLLSVFVQANVISGGYQITKMVKDTLTKYKFVVRFQGFLNHMNNLPNCALQLEYT